MRRFFSSIAQIVYKEKYISLRTQLLLEYSKIDKDCRFDTLSKLLISGEDHRFLYHFGFDIFAIIRATKNRIFSNKIEGASTIEQQIVRVLTNEYKRTFKRKIQEIFLSTTLASNVPRKDLPSLYLNIAYYGTGLNGLQSVLNKFEIPNKEDISIEIAAEIVSRIKYPEPKNKNEQRLRQIEKRKMHLINLYKNHTNRKILRIYE